MTKVLFVCKSNIGRSQMAEVFFESFVVGHEAKSAGTDVAEENEGKPIHTATQKILSSMDEVGLRVGDKIMNQLTPELVREADRVVSMVPEETLPKYLKESPKLEVWDIPDAGGTDMIFHRKIRDLVQEHVREFVGRLDP